MKKPADTLLIKKKTALTDNSALAEEPGVERLVRKALSMRELSYAPYSDFAVGAALEASDGRLFGGCNIENAAYGPTMCAERTALFKAVSEGCRSFRRIVIAGGPAGDAPQRFCPPCGSCRQVLAEFCDPETFEIILAGADGKTETHTLKELLPLGFTKNALRHA